MAQKPDIWHKNQTHGTKTRHMAQKPDIWHKNQTYGTNTRHMAQKPDIYGYYANLQIILI